VKTHSRVGSFLVVLFGAALLSTALGAGPVQIDVVSDTGDRIVLDYRVLDYATDMVTIEGEEYTRIWIPGEAVSLEKGAPALPTVNRSIIIPDDARMAIRVLSMQYEDHLTKIAPSKGPLPRSVDPETVPFEFGAAYGIDSFWPESIASLARPYIMRDHRGTVVRLSPFQYNPASGLLRVYTHLVLEVSAVGPGRTNVLARGERVRAPVRAFEDLYRRHFLNHEPATDGAELYDPMDEQGDMLIIAHDPWISDLDAFVSHKATMGVTATVEGVSTIGNDWSSIKAHIQNVYDTSDLAFVLLVGDAAEVATPPRQVGFENGAADPLYAKLAGADNYPEIMVGRFSAQTLAQLQTQLDRTITYETLPALGADWFWRGTGIASSEGAGIGDEGQSDRQHQDEIRDWLLGAGYTEVDQIYAPGATDTDVHNALNAGRGVVNYTGHGSPTSWGTTGFNNADVHALVNDNMLPFIVSVACNNGEFHHYSECFAEAWLRATNDGNGEPTGAVGMYASSVSQSWAPPMEGQDEFNILLTDPEKPYQYYGTLCFAGSCSMMDKYGASGVEMFDTWIVFGDPSLRVVGDPPQNHGLTVSPADGLIGSGPAGGPMSPAGIDYTLRNRGDFPIDYQVSHAEPWISVTNPTGTLQPGETAQVTVAFNDTSCNCDNGGHSDTVQFVNLTDHDGDTTRPASLSVGQPMIVQQWNLDAEAGWSVEGEWEYGPPAGDGGGRGLNPDPTSGASGANVYGANLLGNISKHVGGPYYLTAGPLDLVGITGVSLTFQRWLNTFGPPEVLSTLEVSGDGNAWDPVWSADGQVGDSAWTSQTFDISSTFDNRSTAYVRWGYQVAGKIPQASSGWNIDDIELEGVPSTARIVLLVDKSSLSWSAAPGAVSYDLVRGDIQTLASSGGDFTLATDTCLADDLPGTSFDFPDVPPAGTGYWFVVRGVTASGAMTYQPLEGPTQVGVRDDEINAATGSCP
jgi:hypothetical protein